MGEWFRIVGPSVRSRASAGAIILIVLEAAVLTVSTATSHADDVLTNLALGMPCEPAPACLILVNGDKHVDRVATAWQGASKADEESAQDFRVFLPRPAFVERIEVFCVGAPQDAGSSSTSHDGGGALHPTAAPHIASSHELVVTLEAKARLSAESGRILPGEAGGGGAEEARKLWDEDGVRQGPATIGVVLEIPVHATAMVVTVSTKALAAGGKPLAPSLRGVGSPSRAPLCGELKTAEVAVIGTSPNAPAALASSNDTSSHSAAASEAGTVHRGYRMPADVRSGSAALEGSLGGSTRMMMEMTPKEPLIAEAVTAADVDKLDYALGLDGDVQQGAASILAVLAAATVGFLLCTAFVVPFAYAAKLRAAKGNGPSCEARAAPALTGTPATSYFFIGDDDSDAAPDTSSEFSVAEPAGATESEPERELDPPSHPVSPRPPDAAPAQKQVPPAVSMGSHCVQPPASPTPPAAKGSSASWSLPAPQISAPQVPAAAVPPVPRRSPKLGPSSIKHVTFLYASPLCSESTAGLQSLQQLPVDQEWGILVQACDEASASMHRSRAQRRQPPIASLSARPLTAGNLQRSLVPSSQSQSAPTVLHLSAHGMNDSLILENARRPSTAHLFTCQQLEEMLQLRTSVSEAECPSLVILNACSSRAFGHRFAESGVPHVLCAASDIRDSWAQLFFRMFYSSLFQGNAVSTAFQAALVALRSDPDTPDAAAAAFCLMPESDSHKEALFTPRARRLPPPMQKMKPARGGYSNVIDSDIEETASDSEVETGRDRRTRKSQAPPVAAPRSSPFECAVPLLPEDFSGRSLDVWKVQQLLSNRRAVVVCGAEGTNHGIGKSAVLDAVQRAGTFNLGATCVAADLRAAGTDMPAADSTSGSWVTQVGEAVRSAILEVSLDDSSAPAPRRCALARQWRQRLMNRSEGTPSDAGSGTSASGPELYPADVESHTSNAPGCSPTRMQQEHEALDSLVADVQVLSRLLRRKRVDREWWPATAANGPFVTGDGHHDMVLLILDHCDALLQQRSFQAALARLLRCCPSCRILLGSQRPAVVSSTELGQFKVVHHALNGISPLDAAQLFLRRAQRPLQWGEILPPGDGTTAQKSAEGTVAVPPEAPTARSTTISSRDLRSPVVLPSNAAARAEVFHLVSKHPAVASQRGHPRALIALASRMGSSLGDMAACEPQTSDCN